MGGKPNPKFLINERREKVLTMISKGLNEKEVAKSLKVNQSTICRDIRAIKKKSQELIASSVTEVLPYEYSKSILTIEQLIKKCWEIIDDVTGKWTNKNKIDVLKLLKEAIRTKLEVVNEGPVNLRASQLEKEVKDLIKEDEVPPRSFFTLGPPPNPNSLDDLR
jgi:transcriptional regulator